MNDDYILPSVSWLQRVRNLDDGGWGMYERHPSRIVTTAEAVTALAIAGNKGHALEEGIRYLLRSAKNPKWCQYTRHHAWIVYALVRADKRDVVPDRCIQSLRRSFANGAWADQKGSQETMLSTFLAWRALHSYDPKKAFSTKVCKRLEDEIVGSGWRLTKRDPSYVATSYAVLILTEQTAWRDKYGRLVEKAVSYLKTGVDSYWPNEHEQLVAGDHEYNYHHFTIPWVAMALLRAGTPVHDPIMGRALSRLYSEHYSSQTGGWSEDARHRPSTFATCHVLAALEVFHESWTVDRYLSKLREEQLEMTRNRVFIVHGHDPVRHEVARFINQIGCEEIILEEQVDAGVTTIFEKFTRNADRAAYAIVLMTPEDTTKDGITGESSARARQNVILELGFFIGKLGSENVCLAKKGNVDVPSDIHGILYVNLDDGGGWKLKLARKLKAAGLQIDLNSV